jgi:hypothetical protein
MKKVKMIHAEPQSRRGGEQVTHTAAHASTVMAAQVAAIHNHGLDALSQTAVMGGRDAPGRDGGERCVKLFSSAPPRLRVQNLFVEAVR